MALDSLSKVTSSGISTTSNFKIQGLEQGITVGGIVTATSFVGDGSGLSGVVGSGSGVIVKDDGALVGTAGTINFGSNLSVSAISNAAVTITATDTNTTYTQAAVADGSNVNLRLTGSDSTIDDILLTAGTNITFSSVTAGGLTISASGGGGGSIAGINTSGTSTFTNLNVTGVSTVGVVTGATYFGDGSRVVDGRWTLGASAGNNGYTFTGIGFTETTEDPILYLERGAVYEFVNNMNAHPFRIQSTPNGSTGTQYDNGVTNNNVSNGTLRFEVPFNAPSILYYQCTAHSNMGGIINILDGTNLSQLNVTGITTVAAGTTAAPSITPTGDSNTGIFFPSADTIAFGEGGSEAARIDSSGRFGLGTTSASVRLHVNVDSASETDVARFQASNGSDVQFLDIGVDPTGNLVSYDATGSTGGAHVFRRGGGEAMRIDDASRLLVGTSSNVGGQGLQVVSGAGANHLGLFKFGNNDDGGELTFGTSRNGTIGSQTIVNNNDFLGRILFRGSDGSAFVRGAEIACQVDGTPGANTMPGRLVFSTTSTTAGASPTERMRIAQDGRVTTKGGGTGATVALNVTNSADTALFNVRNDGLIGTGTATNSPYNFTTASAANMFVDSGGLVYRSTSSLKYKKNVADASFGLQELLSLRAVTYQSKTENDGETVYAGLIAEEVDAAGLQEFVQYADDGTPDALAYGNMVALCIKAIQEQQAVIADLQAKVAALEAQ